MTRSRSGDAALGAADSPLLLSGLGDPVFDASVIFRCLLDAMAHPGRIHDFPVSLEAPTGLNVSACGIALALCDADTPIWLSPDLDGQNARAHVRFHTGAAILDTSERAAFAFTVPSDWPSIADNLSHGDDAYPDRSATAIIQVGSLALEGGVTLTGPGIPTRQRLAVAGMTDDFWNWRRRARALFPLGIDIIFAGPTSIAALPRSTHVEV